MSIKIPVAALTESEIRLCESELIIQKDVDQPVASVVLQSEYLSGGRERIALPPPRRLASSKPAKRIYGRPAESLTVARRDETDHLCIPFHWGVTHMGIQYRTPRSQCEKLSTTFQGTLRPEQDMFAQETHHILEKNGSALLAVYPGGGKCLLKGTLVRLFDGTEIAIEKVTIGMALRGDDASPRYVQALGQGYERMFRIVHSGYPHLNYVVNQAHILTLYHTTDQRIEDIPIDEFIQGTRTVGNYQSIVWPESQYVPFHIEVHGVDEYYGVVVTGNGRFCLANGILTHNTITSLSIAASLGLRTLILVNKVVLLRQWLETIREVFPSTCRSQILYAKTTPDMTCDFYIVNAINIGKCAPEIYTQMRIGFVIVDECHLMMTRLLSKSLLYFAPHYVLGLSATPFRPDGFNSLLDLFFGKEKVIRPLYRPHTVYHVETGYTIQHDKDARGEMIWNSVLEKQTSHEERNAMILQLCNQFVDRTILILSKRIQQIEYLYSRLVDKGDTVTMIRHTDGRFDTTARIVIATYQKVGTGFSHNKLDMLILATDTEDYFIQYLGRVFRRPDVQPIIIDLVDRHPILKRHFQSRRIIYEASGGRIQSYHPDMVQLPPPDPFDCHDSSDVIPNKIPRRSRLLGLS